MMTAKRVATSLFAIIIMMLLTGAVVLAVTPAKARAAETGGGTTGAIAAAVTPANPRAVETYEEISYVLNDSYGDGWNGAKVRIVDTADDSELAVLTIDSGSQAEGTVTLVRGHIYQFVWGSGTWDGECSFTFKSGETIILEGSGSGLQNGAVLLTYMAGVGAYAGHDLWVANTRVANVNEADVLGDGTVSYDPDTHTLTLENCVCVRDGGDNANTSLLYFDDAEGPITINLKGSNVLECAPSDQVGIYAEAGVTFVGDGLLTVTGGGNGDSYGIQGNVTLDSSFTGTVVARGGSTSGDSAGIYASNATVNGGTLIAIGGVVANGFSIGIHADSSFDVAGGTVISQGSAVAGGDSIGVYIGESAAVNVSDGVLLVQGGNASESAGHSRGIYSSNSGSATFSGGVVVVRTGSITTGSTALTSANRQVFSNVSYTCPGMDSVPVGYNNRGRFAAESGLTRKTGFACAPSSWTKLGDDPSQVSLADTLDSDSYFINTKSTSLSTALSSVDTNGHTLFLANLFEGNANTRAAGLALTGSENVSLTGSGSVVAIGGITGTGSSFGLYADSDITVAGPTVVGVSGSCVNDSDGVRCASGALAVSSGKVVGVGSSPANTGYSTHGVYSDNEITVTSAGGVIGIGGTTRGTDAFGIKASGIAVQDSASALGIGGTSSNDGGGSRYGISANSIDVSGGSMAGVGGDCAGSSYGVDDGNVLVRRGACLIAVGSNRASNYSYGIQGLAEGSAFEGDAIIAGTTSAIGPSEGTLLLDAVGEAFGYTDFAGTADETAIESGAELSTLSGYKRVKTDAPPARLASGTSGTCYWEITADKVLTVYPGELESAQDGLMPWYPTPDSTWELSDIERVVIVSKGADKVVAPSDSSYIFGQLTYAKSMDLSGLDTAQAEDLSHLFASSGALETVDVSMLDTSNATTMKSMFQDCSQLQSLDLTAFNMAKVTDASSMFSGCTSLASLNLTGLDMAKVADVSSIFSGCTSLQSLNLSNLNMASVTDVSGMFSGCTSLESLNLSNANMSSVADVSGMFSSCTSLQSLDLPNANMSSAADVSGMFSGCTSLESLDLTGCTMAGATNASNMFSGCTSLQSLGLSNFNMAGAADVSGMFSGCTSLESLDLTDSTMAGATNVSNMFSGCTSLQSLGLSPLGMASVADASGMFSGCTSLASLDLSTLGMANDADVSNMFSGCTKLEILKLGSVCKLASDAALAEAPTAHPYTGKWIRQEGGAPLTAAELMSTYDGSTMAGTYVWEQIVQRTAEELNQLIERATTTSPYNDDSVHESTDGADLFTVEMWVTPEVKEALVAAIAAAQELAANEEATQEQRDTVYYALEAAMANYVPQRGKKEKPVVEAATWSELYELLQENGSNIKLTADVRYGTGGGEHESYALVVPAGNISKLDLNGHIVDRGLGDSEEAVVGGSVITVAGELTIKDSQPAATHSPAVTFVEPLDASKTHTVTGGIITGGYVVSQLESVTDWYFGGGGVLVENDAQLVMTGGSICGNHTTAGQSYGDCGGGGVAVKPNGIFDMSGTAAVCGNLSDDDGGGVFMAHAVLKMDENASISFNTAGDHGGGLYALRCNVTMKGDSKINGNKARAFGGGAYFYYSSTLVMEDNAEIASNYTSYHGGGVAMYSFIATDMTITMKDKSRIYANSCGDDGGGVFLGTDEVVLNMSDESSISGNFASSEGGGVYANGGILNLDGGEISGNSSVGSGGGVCLGNLNGGSQMHMTGGTITGNSTHGSGGGVFAESNARAFTIEGTVVIDGNEIVDGDGNHVSENNIHGAAGSGSSMTAPITVTGALGEGSAIGITQWGAPGEDSPLDAVSGFAENNPDLDPASIFTSDSTDYIVVVSAAGEPQLALPEGMGIWIGGKRVSVLNATDVFGNGQVSYDQATKTLTLNGYNYDGYGDAAHHAALATTVENLTVNLVGDNKIVESGYHNWFYDTDCFGIWAANGLNFTGSGTLEAWAYYENVEGTTGAGIFVASGSLTVGEEFTGELWAHANRGIGAYAAGVMSIESDQVKFSGGARAVMAVSVFLGKDLVTYGSEAADANEGAVLAVNEGTGPLNITASVGESYRAIWTGPLQRFGLWVNGEQFSNAKPSIACGEGTAVFNPEAETPTLTLTNATITSHPSDSAMSAGIYSTLPNLVIKTAGANVIKPTDEQVDGVLAADGCNIAVTSVGDSLGTLKLEDVNYGFNIGGTIDIAGYIETTSAAGGTNVPDSAIALAKGWGYTQGTSLTQSGKVVIGEVVTATFDGNGHGGVLATLQVPKGKSLGDACYAMSEEAYSEFEAKIHCELADGGKKYAVEEYYTTEACSIQIDWSTPLNEDTAVFAKWIECVDVLEITVASPVCETETRTEKDGDDLVYWMQTNKPAGTITDPRCVLEGDSEWGWYAGWLEGDVTSVIANAHSAEPYQGTFVGGNSYTFWGDIFTREGYWFSKDVVVKVNGVECALYPTTSFDRECIEIVSEVAAAHVLTEEPTQAEVPATCGSDGMAAYWTCSACGKLSPDAAGTSTIDAPQVIPATGNHSWNEGTVTKEPTLEEDGECAFECTECGATKTEAIPKLVLGDDGTALGPGASAALADLFLTTKAQGESEPVGTVFSLLRAKVKKLGKTSITLAWSKVPGATKYVVYGEKCGKGTKRVKIATITGCAKAFANVAGKKVMPKTFYKFNVVALDKNDRVLSTSKTIHVVTKGGGKYCNEKSVSVKKSVKAKAKRLKAKKSLKLKAKAVRASKDVRKRLKLARHRGIAYESSNPKIATVTAKGVVKAKKKGTCYIYAYAQCGVYAQVKVVVK